MRVPWFRNWLNRLRYFGTGPVHNEAYYCTSQITLAPVAPALADTIDLPCRIAKGCKYCKRDDASSCLIRSGIDKLKSNLGENRIDVNEKECCVFFGDHVCYVFMPV